MPFIRKVHVLFKTRLIFPHINALLPFCKTETNNFLVTHYFYGGIVVFAQQKFCCLCSCSLFFHFCSVLPCWPQAFLMFLTVAMKFLCFSSNKICLLSFKSLALALTFVSLWCGRTVTRVYSHMITKISQMDGLCTYYKWGHVGRPSDTRPLKVNFKCW